MKDQEDLQNLAAIIATRRCALFAGSGLTASSGGASWFSLIEYLKDKYHYTSPLTNPFDIMGDMCRSYGKSNVYEEVKNRLKDARIEEPILKLTTLPWFTAFTTNYDLALEKSLEKNQSLFIRTITTGNEFALTGLPSEMLCVKLMGSLDVNFNQPGSMVLDQGDLGIAQEQRYRIFDILSTHANNLSFLFVGYSFQDDVFFEILYKLTALLGVPKNTYYAVFKTLPNKENAYKLEKLNVKVIVSDLADFSTVLKKLVATRDPKDFSKKRIPLGNDVIPIDTTHLAHFFSFYNPVLFEDVKEDVSPNTFLKGDTRSLKPFELGWHFQRKETYAVIETVIKFKYRDNKTHIISVEGNPGTGRTFTILATVYKLIAKHRALAIKLSINASNTIPSKDSLSMFVQEVMKQADEVSVAKPERIILWSETRLTSHDISQFNRLVAEFEESNLPIILITEDVRNSLISADKKTVVNVDSDLSDPEKERCKDYLLDTIRMHKLPAIAEEEVRSIINQEKRLLPIVYRTLDPAKRSIDKIISEEFGHISDLEVKNSVSICAVSASMDLDMPLAVLRKALNKAVGKDLSYPEIFEIVSEKAITFIKLSEDVRTNPLVNIYHSIIAQRIMNLIGPSKADEYLLIIAQVVDLKSRVEAEFAGNLLITRGVNLDSGLELNKTFTDDGLERALSELKKRQPARPIIHHLARLYVKKDILDVKIIPLLNEALAEPTEKYLLEERVENVLTTLGKTMWEQNKILLRSESREHPEVKNILALLIKARTGSNVNIHPYDVHVRILQDLWRTKPPEEKVVLVNEAIDVVNEGISISIDSTEDQQRMRELLIATVSEIDYDTAQRLAKEMLLIKKDGAGYYMLAQIELYKKSNVENAINNLDEAMRGETYPIGAIALKIEILLQQDAPDYAILLKLVDKLSSSVQFQETWKSAYHKGLIYTVSGRYYEAVKAFNFSFRKSPITMQKRVQLFWMEKGRRKALVGKIARTMEKEGRIFGHEIKGWKEDIFFDPRNQKLKLLLQTGLSVEFELGFSPRGPIAFDVRPIK